MPARGVNARDLLAGPRGLELCARLAEVDPRDIRNGVSPITAADLLNRLRQQRALPGLDGDGPLAAVSALADVAEGANYWSGWPAGPLEHPAVMAELRAIATRVAQSAGCQWWWSPAILGAQRYVQWPEEPAPVLGGAAEEMRRVSAEAINSERSMSRSAGGPRGRARRNRGHRVAGCAQWQRSCLRGRRPICLAGARHQVSQRSYGHLPAYLGMDGLGRRMAGASLGSGGSRLGRGPSERGRLPFHRWSHPPAGSARTLLAGWNPDETYWLTDVITSLGEEHTWHNPGREPLGWKMRAE
jgi:hypothetical protein